MCAECVILIVKINEYLKNCMLLIKDAVKLSKGTKVNAHKLVFSPNF